MNKMVKADMVFSTKGPSGGFYISDKTLDIPLIQLYHLFEGSRLFDECSLHFKKCTEEDACPLHHRVEQTKKNIQLLLSQTTIRELLNEEKPDIMWAIASA